MPWSPEPTARAITGWWNDDLAPDLRDSGHAYTMLDLGLPDRHPRTTGVFRAALRSFAAAPGMGAPGGAGPAPGHVEAIRPPAGRWTTLDLIMLAWLSARGTARLPADQGKLYEEILRHEIGYWRRTFSKRHGSEPVREVLRAAGACVTLLAPAPQRVEDALSAVKKLAGQANARYRGEIAAVLRDLLSADPGDNTVALRPDPVGDCLHGQWFGGGMGSIPPPTLTPITFSSAGCAGVRR